MLDMYMDFKLFELFRDKLMPVVRQYNGRDSLDPQELYKHIFLSPASSADTRSFKVLGAQFPYVCLWSTSPLNYNTDYGLYGKSVLPVDCYYKDKEGNDCPVRGFFYDYQKTYEVSAGSYFRDYVGSVNQVLHEVDRLRYFTVKMDELVPGFESRLELKLDDTTFEDNVDEDDGNRSFKLQASYKLSVTLFVPQNGFDFASAIRLYLNDNLIYNTGTLQAQLTS